nr:PKD domain-containing protein [Bacteroidota bacterium]
MIKNLTYKILLIVFFCLSLGASHSVAQTNCNKLTILLQPHAPCPCLLADACGGTAPYIFTYLWSDGSTTSCPGALGSGPYVVTVYVMDAQGQRDSITRMPSCCALTCPNDTTICYDLPDSLVVLGTPTISAGSNGGTGPGGDCLVDSIWNNSTGVYPVGTTIITWTAIVNGQIKTCTQKVIRLNTGPVTFSWTTSPLPLGDGKIHICRGDPVYFSDSGAVGITNWEWDFGDGYASSLNNPTHFYNIAGTWTAIVKGYDACGNLYLDSIDVIVDPSAGPDIFCISVQCPGDTAVYHTNACGGASYQWTVSANGTILGSSTLDSVVVIWNAGPVGTISLLVTGCPGVCTNPSVRQVYIVPPTMPMYGDTVICQGTPSTDYEVQCIPGTNYNWTISPPSSYFSIDTFMHQITINWDTAYTGPVTITVNYQNVLTGGGCDLAAPCVSDPGCGGSVTRTVFVKPVFKINGPAKLCLGVPNTSNPFTSNTAATTWKLISPGGTSISGFPVSNTFNTYTWDTAGFYTVIATTPAGPFCNDSAFLFVEVLDLIPTPIVNGPDTVCDSTSYTYNITPNQSGVTYIWTVTNGTPNGITTTLAPSLAVQWFAGGGTISVRQQLTLSPFCESLDTMFNIVIYPPIVPPTIIGPASMCEKTIKTYYFNVGALQTDATYSWSVSPTSAGTIVSTNNKDSVTIKWIDEGNAFVKLKINLCGTDSSMLAVFVDSLPAVPNISYLPANPCMGDVVNFSTTSNGPGWQWNWNFGDPFATIPNPNTAITQNSSHIFTADGNYTVRLYVVNANGCADTSFATVHVDSVPQLPILAGDDSVCVGQTATYSFPQSLLTGALYTWSVTTQGFILSGQGTNSIVVQWNTAAPQNAQVMLNITSKCPITVPAFNVFINTPPTASFTSTSPQCAGSNMSFTGSGGGTYSWSFPGALPATSTIVNPVVVYSGAGTYTVTLTVTDANGCTATTTSPVVVNPPPGCIFATTTNDLNVCSFPTTVTVSASNAGGYTYMWTPANTNASFSTTITGPTSFFCIITNTNGCSAMTNTLNFVQDTLCLPPDTGDCVPSLACNMDFTWTPPICKTDSFIYTGTATLTGWDFGDANTGGAVSPITHTYATIGSYNVTAMGTCAGTTFPTGVGCIANIYKTHSVIIPVDPCFTINFRCVANVIFTDIADCSCMIGNASGYTWAWYLNGSLIPFSTAQNPPSQLLTGTNTIVMKMTNIATGAVCTTSQTFTVPTPIVAAFTAPTPVCIGTSVNFVDMSAGSVSRLWTFAGSANPSSSGAASASVLYTGVGGLANLSVTDAYGCTSSTSQLITVNPAGVGSITVGISSCDSVQLTASGTGPFSWSNVNPPNNVNPIYVKQNGFYSVTAIDPTFGCSYTATTTQIIVNASPVANITGPTKYCPGENLDLKTSAGGNSTTYSWVQTPTGSVVGTSANLTIPVPTAGTYTYTVTITANGCTSTASIVVTIDAVPISAVIDSSGSLTFCQGDSVNLFVNPAAIGGSYTWTKTPPPTITDTNPNFWVTVGGTYNVTVVTANGCPYPAISPVVVNVCDLPLTAISGDTVYCEGETLMLQTFPGFTYQWYYNGLPLSSTYGAVADMNFDIVIPNLLPTFSGMYCVVATNNCGCKDSVCVNVVVNPLPATPIITPFTGPYPGSIPASLPLCEGPLYTLKVTPTYSPSIKLTWNTGQVGSVVPAAFAKDYIVTATDTTTGCNVSSTITVNPLPDLSCAPSGCYDFCNECGAVTIPGPEGITTYQWEQKVGVTWVAYSNTQNITVTSPGGTFRLIGYNIFGCSDTSQNLVINFQDCCDTNACNINIDLVKKNVSCYGANDGTATAVASGGTPIYTYTWSGGTIVTATDGSVSNATGLSPGTYTVIVTDSVSCSDTATFTITEPPQIILNLTAYASACSDTCNGYIDIAVDSGFAPYDIIVYGPNPGDTAALILNINDTLYGNGMGSVSYVAGFFCNGIYTVVVTDSNGCTVIADVELVDTNQIVLTETHVNVACNGEATGSIDLTVTGGFPPVTYLWNNGETTQDIDTLYAGLYSVIVTDSNGCTSELIVEITENPPFFIGKTLQNNQCHGDSTGQISIFVSGAVPFTSGAPYTYLWSDGQTTSVANYLVAGTYTVTVTDSIGCDTILTFQIFEPTLLDQTHTITQPLCNGGTGDITVNGFGGTPWSGSGAHAAGYEYSLDGGTSQTNGTFTGITGGSHTIAITDSNSCITYFVSTINVPTPLVCGGAGTNVMCNGGNNGSITANITGGTGNYSYVWNDGSTNQTLNGLTSGEYTVTVTDGNGCTIECTYTITEPLPITFTAAACANVSCFGGNDGKACVTNVLGGTAPYTYQWNTLPAQTTAQATGLTAGTWTVTITDAMGCMVMGDVVITQPAAALSITGIVTNTTCNGGNNGAINITVTGGTAPTTLLWSNGNTTTSNTGLVAGTYTVTVTDANNCTAAASYTVGQPTAIAISLVSTNVSCNGGANGSITANVSGGTGAYSYAWSNGGSTSGVSGLAAGIYTVTVTDANGCTTSASATITSPSALGCICNSNVTNVSCFGGSNGSVTAQPLGGTAPYSFVWSTGATTQTISSLAAGTYTVNITDANGCTKVGTATITQPNALVLTVTGNNLTCNGNGGGSATASISGGIAPYTYLWTPTGQTTATATGLAAGSYTVQVTDANGCTVTGQVTLTQPAPMNLTSKKTNVSCFGGTNGTLTVVTAGGTSPYAYLWSNGKTTKYIIGLAAGTYTVTVTDANGCTKTLSNSVGQPARHC